MASLSKHGEQLGVIEYITRREAHYANGEILINRGDGWKVKGKVKTHVNPREYYAKRKTKLEDKERRMPAYLHYKTLLYKYVPQTHRWMVNAAVDMMPTDPDGVWSQINDHGDYRYNIDLDEAVELCRAYEAATREATTMNEQVS